MPDCKPHECKAGTTKIVLCSDGRFVPCEAFKGHADEFCIGDIRKGDTLRDAMRNAHNHVKLNVLKWLTGNPCNVAILWEQPEEVEKVLADIKRRKAAVHQ